MTRQVVALLHLRRPHDLNPIVSAASSVCARHTRPEPAVARKTSVSAPVETRPPRLKMHSPQARAEASGVVGAWSGRCHRDREKERAARGALDRAATGAAAHELLERRGRAG